MNDKELIRQIQSGHKELLNDVIQRYYEDILHFCIYQIRDVSYAYDLTQETFYRFIRCVDTYQCRNLKAYLIRIARNLCIDYWRGRIDTIDIDGPELIDQMILTDKDKEFEKIENGMVLADFLSELSVEQREVVVMRYYCDLKIKDIAKILEVNLSTVKSRLRLGVLALKKIAESRNLAGKGEIDSEKR